MSVIWTGTFTPSNACSRGPPPQWSAARLRRALFNPPSVTYSCVLKHSITNTVWLSVPTSRWHCGEIRAKLHSRQDQAESFILISMRVKITDGKWNDLPSFNKQDGASVCRGADDVDPGLRSLYLKTVITIFFEKERRRRRRTKTA